MHGHGEMPEALTGDLQLPVGSLARLEHEGTRGAAREETDEAARVAAPDLLVRIDEHDGQYGRLQPELAQCAQRKHDLHEAALHVRDAGAVEQSVLTPKRHPGERPDGPDRIHVTEQQLARVASVALPGPCVEVIAHLVVAPDRAHDELVPLELRGENAKRPALGLGLERRRLRPCEPLQ